MASRRGHRPGLPGGVRARAHRARRGAGGFDRGIPLIGAMPFLVAAAGLAGTAGFTAVAARVGARLRGTRWRNRTRSGSTCCSAWPPCRRSVSSPVSPPLGSSGRAPRRGVSARSGLLIEYLVWTIGIGAACATMLARWNGPRPRARDSAGDARARAARTGAFEQRLDARHHGRPAVLALHVGQSLRAQARRARPRASAGCRRLRRTRRPSGNTARRWRGAPVPSAPRSWPFTSAGTP